MAETQPTKLGAMEAHWETNGPGEGAASPQTLMFMLVVIGLLLLVILFYTTYTYRVFRGKATSQE